MRHCACRLSLSNAMSVLLPVARSISSIAAPVTMQNRLSHLLCSECGFGCDRAKQTGMQSHRYAWRLLAPWVLLVAHQATVCKVLAPIAVPNGHLLIFSRHGGCGASGSRWAGDGLPLRSSASRPPIVKTAQSYSTCFVAEGRWQCAPIVDLRFSPPGALSKLV